MDASPDNAPTAVVEGIDGFREALVDLVRDSRDRIDVLSQALDSRAWGTEATVDALRAFVLGHQRTRLRILVAHPKKALAGSTRLVEFCRAMTSFVEVRSLRTERVSAVREELVIGDGRRMLLRDTPDTLTARVYAGHPVPAHERQKDFNVLWDESPLAQELRGLRL